MKQHLLGCCLITGDQEWALINIYLPSFSKTSSIQNSAGSSVECTSTQPLDHYPGLLSSWCTMYVVSDGVCWIRKWTLAYMWSEQVGYQWQTLTTPRVFIEAALAGITRLTSLPEPVPFSSMFRLYTIFLAWGGDESLFFSFKYPGLVRVAY